MKSFDHNNLDKFSISWEEAHRIGNIDELLRQAHFDPLGAYDEVDIQQNLDNELYTFTIIRGDRLE